MIHFALTEAGAIHRLQGVSCQDHAAFFRKGSVGAIASCDGAGSLSHPDEGAKAVSQLIVRWLAEHFDRLYEMHETILRNQLMEVLVAELNNVAQHLHEPPDELGSTLMAVCADQRDGRYMTVHIGDGVIAAIDGQHSNLTVLSAPERGACEEGNATYLTSCIGQCPEHIRIKKGTAGQIKQFMLLSDGAENSLYCDNGMTLSPSLKEFFSLLLSEGQEVFAQLLTSTIRKVIKPMDDFSINMLCCVPVSSLRAAGYDPCRDNLRARRIAKMLLKYGRARDENYSVANAVRKVGWHTREKQQHLLQAIHLGLESF